MTESEKGGLQQKTFNIKWKIERFFADCDHFGDSYKSPVFPIRHSNQITNWYLQIYPKGKNEKNKDWVQLYLYYETESLSEVTVDFQLSILREKNSVSRLIKAKTFKGPKFNWGWSKFVKQDAIKDTKNGPLIDDTLTILCEITFDPKAQDVDTGKFKEYDDLLNNIGQGFGDYEKLLESKYFSDVTFNVQGKQIHMHKAILMCRNPVFKAMFEHGMKENQESSVDITDVNYEVMKELFRFIYSGKVENIEKLAQDLLIAADKYCVTELKALCEKTLCHNLTIDNAIEYLKLVDVCDTIHLKAITINFVTARYKDVVEKSEFSELPQTIMCEIIRAVAQKN